MVLVFAIVVGFFSPKAYAVTGNAATDRLNEGKKNYSDDVDYWNDYNIDLSFAYQVRMATNYANRQYSVGNDIGKGVYDRKLNMSNIAPFFGYSSGEIETDFENSPENTRTVSVSDSNVSYASDLLAHDGSYSKGTRYYYYYGLILNLMGFDSVGSTGATNTVRTLFGWVAIGSYYAASSVNLLFEMTFDFLYATNPFMFFKDINTSSTSGDAELDAIYDNASDAWEGNNTDSTVGTLAKFFSNIYNTLANFAWTISIPLAVVFIIVSFFLTRRGRYSFGSKMKQVLIKIVFLAVGIPILGSAYTQVLIALKDSQAMSDEFITEAVTYTFVDFGKWVETSRLELPHSESISLITAAKEGGEAVVSSKTWLSLRELCSAINIQSGVINKSTNTYLTVDDDSGILLKDFIYDTGSTTTLSTTATSYGSTNFGNRDAIAIMLKKYRDGETYSADVFKGGVVSWMNENTTGSTVFGDMLALSCDKYSFSQNAERTIHGLQGDVDGGNIKYDATDPSKSSAYSTVAANRFGNADFAGVGYNIWDNGNNTGLGAAESAPADKAQISSGWDLSTGGITYTGSGSSGNGYDCTEKCGFSTMAMYTYLTSEFTQTGITVYDSAPSVYTQNSHYAVNLIGGDFFMQAAFFSNTIAILLGYFVLAVAFILRTGFDILFKGIQFMGHALLAAVGFYKSIGTCICMVVNMIAQLFVSVMFFSFMVDLMFMISSVLNKFFVDIFNVLTGNGTRYLTTSSSYAAEVLVICSSFLAAFAIVFFVSFAIKWRALIMSSINSMVENIVGTLLGVSLTGTSDGVAGGMAKAALGDAVSVATGAATVAGGMKLVDEVGVMTSDLITSGADALGIDTDGEAEDTEGVSAADAAVAPTVGAGFDGGAGANEGDQENMAEGKDALENGLGSKEQTAEETDNTEKTETENDTSDNETNENSQADVDTGTVNDEGILERDGTDASGGETNNTSNSENNNSQNSKTNNTNNNISNNENNGASDKAEADNLSEEEDVLPERFIGPQNLGLSSSKSKKTNTDSANKSSDTTSASGNNTENATNTTADDTVDENDASLQISETGDGTWSQIDTSTGAQSGISFDAARGIVLTSVDENGVASDVALGLNGLSLGSTDADGNRTITAINSEGMSISHDGVDGSSENIDVAFDGTNSNVQVNRVDANGNTEEIATGLNGTTKKITETTADGSKRVTTINADGSSSIHTVNAETGYESTEEIAADGSVDKYENINGVETYTQFDSDGVMRVQKNTSTGANGELNETSWVFNDDGSIDKSITIGNTTTKTRTEADGSETETQTTKLDNGLIAETTSQYDASGASMGDARTVIKSMDGKTVVSDSASSTGTDENGNYKITTATTAAGTVEYKEYENGQTVSTETDLAGNVSVVKFTENGGYEINETNAATGESRLTTIDKNGKGKTVITNADTGKQETVNLSRGSDGVTSYSTMTGGSISMSTSGEGDEKTNVTTQSFITGGQRILSTNDKTGSVVTTVTDSVGSESITNYDAATGTTTYSTIYANGNTMEATQTANGNYNEVTSTANGGQRIVTRSGTGDAAVEQLVKTDAAGNKTIQRSQGGQVVYTEGTSMNGDSYVQERGNDGTINTTQTFASGDAVVTSVQPDGDFTRTTNYANGASRVESVIDNVTRIHTTSVTGIETSVLREGSATTSTVGYSGVTMSEYTNTVTGEFTKKIEIPSGQTYELITDNEGASKTVFEMPNGAYGSFKTNSDGSQVHIIRQADNSSRIETVSQAGESSVVYTDCNGTTITEETAVTRLNDVYAEHLSAFNTGTQRFAEYVEKINAVSEFTGVSSLSDMQVDPVNVPLPVTGMTGSDFNEKLLAAQLESMTSTSASRGSMEDYETRKSGSATGNNS